MDTTVSDPLVGRLLDGRYRVGRRLARGGMAVVYEAHDSRLDRTIALKVMHASLADDDEFVSRFIREAHAAARLSHPNVVAVYDQGADQGHVFLAMELVRGQTLRDLIRRERRLSPRQALDVLEPVLAALGAAHQAGLIHRDVKPENVLISDKDADVKVADFGLARAISEANNHTTASGVVMGTVAYLSPEQVTRGVADPRSDVYSAGILLYEMLTGAKPYDGETAIQIAYRHVHDDVPAPSLAVAGLPAELDHLVARATDRDPDRRPSDARRFHHEVVSARRAMSDAELDALGPGLGSATGGPDHTMVVDLTSRTTTGRAGATPPPGQPAALVGTAGMAPAAAVAARRGDTGPLSASAAHDVRRRRRRRGPIALGLILLLALALSIGAWLFAAGPLSRITTPSLLKLAQADAVAKARADGLKVRVTGQAFSEVALKGVVVETKPHAGSSIAKGGTIAVVLSKGPERYAVPELVNRTEDVARTMLAGNHLSVAPVVKRYNKAAEGTVISTVPAAGQLLKRDQTVQLVVSKGLEPVPLPDVVGKPADQASAAITAAQLVPKATEKYNRTVPKGSVISQSPPATKGTAGKGTDVTIVVSKGPPLVVVPDLGGKTLGEAQTALAALRLGSSVIQVPGGPGIVRSQNPGGGEKLPEGENVTVYVF